MKLIDFAKWYISKANQKLDIIDKLGYLITGISIIWIMLMG